MNRFKFRVWRYCHAIKSNKFYYLNYCKIASNEGADICFQEEDCSYYDDSVDNIEKDCVIQQFTGLLDKNGKEIYEGDIVKWQEEVTAGGYNLFNFQVKYNTNSGFSDCLGGFYLEAINYKNSYTNDKFVQTCGLIQNNSPDGYCIKIIGNIFENPEFLEKK